MNIASKNLLILVILLQCFICSAQILRLTECQKFAGYFPVTFRGKRGKDQQSKTIDTISDVSTLQHCTGLCTENLGCLSVSYDIENNKCLLLNKLFGKDDIENKNYPEEVLVQSAIETIETDHSIVRKISLSMFSLD